MRKTDFKKLLPVISLCAAVIFMAAVPSVPVRYSPRPDEAIVKYGEYLYFDFYISIYFRLFPFITAALTCIWLALSLLAFRYRRGSFKLLSLGELISSKPIVLGLGTAAVICSGACIALFIADGLFSPGSVIIFGLLALALISQGISYFPHSRK